jgi:hypothetical protein
MTDTDQTLTPPPADADCATPGDNLIVRIFLSPRT